MKIWPLAETVRWSRRAACPAAHRIVARLSISSTGDWPSTIRAGGISLDLAAGKESVPRETEERGQPVRGLFVFNDRKTDLMKSRRVQSPQTGVWTS